MSFGIIIKGKTTKSQSPRRHVAPIEAMHNYKEIKKIGIEVNKMKRYKEPKERINTEFESEVHKLTNINKPEGGYDGA